MKEITKQYDTAPQPHEVSLSLMSDFHRGQAEAIASEVYQPLFNLINDLVARITELERVK